MTTKTEQRHSLEDLTTVRIVRLSELISRLATRRFEAQFGLRNTDLRILNILDGEDGVSVNEISRRTHVDKAWISRSLKGLAERGLVERRADTSDSRRAVIDLTEKGREILAKVRPVAQKGEDDLLRGLDGESVSLILERLTSNAEEMLEQL